MFFTSEQIEQSVKRLNGLNPFFGTVFLALSELDTPVGTTSNIDLSDVLEKFLQKYYKPLSNYEGFYTPFKTNSNNKRWMTGQYTKTLYNATSSTFSDVFIHPKGSHEWGWKTSYIDLLTQDHLSGSVIPAFDLAVWLFRARDWHTNTSISDILETFISEFHISEFEKKLFLMETRPNPLVDSLFQEHTVDAETILHFIGYPESKVTQRSSNTNQPLSDPPLFLFGLLSTLAEYGAKLQYLKLSSVGPSEDMELNLAPRLNLITGDNALGKTFLLDCAWWALTETWAKYPASPRLDAPKEKPSISFQIGKESQPNKIQKVPYNWRGQSWSIVKNRTTLPGLSIYSQADGSFAVWDPAKFDEALHADGLMKLSPTEIWDGLREQRGEKAIVRCNGLIYDWRFWQNDKDQTLFNAFIAALTELSPHSKYPLVPDKPTRISEDTADVREIPTLKFPYGIVPVTHCSAGIKRIVTLAYLLVWAWHEHVVNSEKIREEPQRSIVLLIDEMEAHLHPFWQRVIVPAVMRVVQALSHEVGAQIIIATHSPLVLASVEPLFDEDVDNLFHLRLEEEDGSVHLEETPFVKMGRVDHWLMSDVFGLEQPRSIEAEQVIAEANEVQLEKKPSEANVQKIDAMLTRVLGTEDEYWPTWRYFVKQRREKVS